MHSTELSAQRLKELNNIVCLAVCVADVKCRVYIVKWIETYRSNKSHNTANGTQARNTAATSKANKPEQSVVHNYFNYLDGGEVLKAACATAAFVPLSVGGGYLVNSIFNAPTASQFVAEFAIGQNISMLQTAAEYIIQIFE